MAIRFAKRSDPRLLRRRRTDRPLTLAGERRWYETPRSFTDLLPWVDSEEGGRILRLADGRSVGALFELIPVACEARPPEFLRELQDQIRLALAHALPEDEPPWVLQVFLQAEPVRAELVQALRAAVEPAARGSAYTAHYLDLLDAHLRQASRPGYFVDRAVTGRPWRAGLHRVRLVLYRWLPPGWRSALGLTPTQELEIAAERLLESLRAAGLGIERRGGADLHRWLVRWFNPCPAVPDPDPEILAETLGYAADDPDRPYGADLAESLLLGMPASDLDAGLWWFDGQPRTVVTVQRLLRAPAVGHLTAERELGRQLASVWDQFPEGTTLVMTLVARAQDRVGEDLARIERRAVGDAAEAVQARAEVGRARAEIARHNKLYPLGLALYLGGRDVAELRRREEQVNALLLAERLQPISREHDRLRLDAYIRNLPMNFDPARDRETRWTRHAYAEHAAALLPFYGRARGTGHPGLIAFNRGGEPVLFDPLHRADRKRNAHTLIVGPPGSGKSSFLLAVLATQLAVRRPRIVLTEVGRSFELFAEYLRAWGLTVRRATLAPGEDVSLPPFSEAFHLRPWREAGGDADEASEAPWNPDEPDDETTQRDVLAEMELAARLMVTGGDAREADRITRADQRLLQRAILAAGPQVRAAGRDAVLTADVARALRGLDDLEGRRRERAGEMADCLELYCEGFAGQVFNRAGASWPEADVTVLNLGAFAQEGYEDKLALAVIGLVNHVNALAERTRYADRQIILCFDEAHLVTTHPLLAPYLTKATKVWGRRYAVWLWLATQNMEDFPAGARRMLNSIEWWIGLSMPPEEVERLAAFRELTREQRALLLAVRKEPGLFSEGVLLHEDQVALFRHVPPPLLLALAQTEQHERAHRARLMREHGCSELEAVHTIARQIEASRGGQA